MLMRFKHFSRFFAILWSLVGGFLLLSTFQNCSGGGAGLSDIFDSNLTSLCLGINCQRDLNTAIIKTNTTGILVDKGTAWKAECDATTCFDVGGFCETGGFPNSVFIYQWTLAGQSALAEVRTSASCDENGRFHFQVHVPANFNWTQMHSLKIYMKVIDESHAEQINPSGANSWSYVVSSRSS